MASRTAVSVEEYLNGSYDYAPEYVDGEVEERSMPNILHSVAFTRIIGALDRATSATGLFPLGELHLRLQPTRYRIPDICLFADRIPAVEIPAEPPFGIVEVLSPDDKYSKLLDKLDEYEQFGVSHIWLVDPGHRRISRYEKGSLIPVSAIDIPERGFRLTAIELFA